MGKKLLLADNSATIQKLVEMALADTDYELEMVGDGADALKVLETFRPDIVLAAAIMPMMDGYRLCEEIKKHADFGQIPVILSTSRFRPYDQERADQVGVSARLVKPFSQELLLEALEQMLQSSDDEDADVEDEEDLLPEVSDDILEADEEGPEPIEMVSAEEEGGDLATVAMSADDLKEEMAKPSEEDLPGPAEEMLLEDDEEPSFDDVQFDDDEAEVASQVSEAFANADTEPLSMEDEPSTGHTMELNTQDLEDLDQLDEDELEDLDDDHIEDFDTTLEEPEDEDAEAEVSFDMAEATEEAIEVTPTPGDQLDEVSFDVAEEDASPIASDEAFDLEAPDSLEQVNMDDDEALDLENVSFDTGETDPVTPGMDTEPLEEESAHVADEHATLPQEPLADEADADDALLDVADDEAQTEDDQAFAAEPESFDDVSPLDVDTTTAEFEEFDQPLLEDEAEPVADNSEYSEAEPLQTDNENFDPAAEYDTSNDVDLSDSFPEEDPEDDAEVLEESDAADVTPAEAAPAAEVEVTPTAEPEASPIATEDEQPPAAVENMSEAIAEAAQEVPGTSSLNADQMDQLAERVAEKVLARLTSDTVRDIAWEVVPELAEAMIKRRIYELEQSAEDA